MDPAREAHWARKLRPFRLRAEPVEEQIARRFLATVAISALTGLIGLILLAIFAAFGRADIGLGIVGLILVPATAWSWADYATLRRQASAYIQEKSASDQAEAPPR